MRDVAPRRHSTHSLRLCSLGGPPPSPPAPAVCPPVGASPWWGLPSLGMRVKPSFLPPPPDSGLCLCETSPHAPRLLLRVGEAAETFVTRVFRDVRCQPALDRPAAPGSGAAFAGAGSARLGRAPFPTASARPPA